MQLRELVRSERGAAAAEFMIAFPVLALAYFSFMQMAQAYEAGIVMRHATEITARYASVSYPDRFIPDGSDRAGETGKGNPSWRDAAVEGLGPWKSVVQVTAAEVSLAGAGRDPWGDLRVTVNYTYTCRVPLGRNIVCRNGILNRTMHTTLPLNGARYVL